MRVVDYKNSDCGFDSHLVKIIIMPIEANEARRRTGAQVSNCKRDRL